MGEDQTVAIKPAVQLQMGHNPQAAQTQMGKAFQISGNMVADQTLAALEQLSQGSPPTLVHLVPDRHSQWSLGVLISTDMGTADTALAGLVDMETIQRVETITRLLSALQVVVKELHRAQINRDSHSARTQATRPPQALAQLMISPAVMLSPRPQLL